MNSENTRTNESETLGLHLRNKTDLKRDEIIHFT